MVVGGDATVSSGDTNTKDILVVKDTEVSSVATRNLIVVGGSCINSAAAALVGGSKCGASWTEATGVGQGQFLIKGYADSTITTGFALLVAGYDVDDTVKASTYLTNKVVDTSKALKGTSSTLVAVEIEEA
jgi:S-layer protein (TIGR01564 family)